jgi:outer membrane protein TolC
MLMARMFFALATKRTRGWLTLICAGWVSGCAHFQPQPLAPEKTAAQLEARRLDDAGLKAFLAAHLARGWQNWPRTNWDLNSLTLVALYYQPTLAEARAQLRTAQAAKITAGERPNPTVSVTPGYDSQIPGNFSPWLVPVSLDVPIETAGKRGRRLDEAQHLAEAAHWNLVGTLWQVRSQVRSALLNLYSARETGALLGRQERAQRKVVRLLEDQFAAGAVSSYEISQARTALATTQLAWQAATGKADQARVEIARALGLPARALAGAEFSDTELTRFPPDLTRPEVRQQALLNRADVRGALAEYAASQSALQLEIANQYPDLHLGPGYAWNNGNAGDNEWQLGLTLTLPMLNHNQGPVAETEARRRLAAAHFLTVQATAAAEIDGALTGYRAALRQVATAQTLLESSQQQLDSVRAQAQAGEMDALAEANAEVEFATGAQNHLAALIGAQQALGALEDAVQSPLTMPAEIIRTAQNHASPISK